MHRHRFKKLGGSRIKYKNTLGCRILMVAVVFTAVMVTGQARVSYAQPSSNQWQFAITPYLWLPNVDGTLKYTAPPEGGGSPEVEVGPNDYLENLDFVLMINAEVRKARWSVFTDVIYLDFSDEESGVKSIDFVDGGRDAVSASIDAGTKSSLTGATWTLAGGYSVLQGDFGRFELLAGLPPSVL